MMPTTVDKGLDHALAMATADYVERNPASADHASRAARSLPGGNTRTSVWHAPFPLCMAGGHDARLTDIDGHSYRDFLGEFTSGIYGHSPSLLRQAIVDAFDAGVALSGHNRVEADFATAICARFPAMDQLRFTNSGTEANLMAIAAAKLFTKRQTVLVFEGGYHGTGLTFGQVASSTIVPHRFILGRYNDIAGTCELARAHRGDLAAILVEPMQGAGGCVPADPAFLAALRDLATELGALLIFDEVQTSRLAVGGRQGLLGLSPDLTTLGKFYGGSLAFGCFGGRADIMAMFDPRVAGSVAHSGTFNNNVLTMSAGLAAVTHLLTEENLTTLNARGEALRLAMNALFARMQAPFNATGLGSLMNIHPSGSASQVAALRKLLHFDMLEADIYFAQRGLIALSMPLNDDDVAAFLEALERFIIRRRALFPAC